MYYDNYLIEEDVSPRFSGTEVSVYICGDSPYWEQYFEVYVRPVSNGVSAAKFTLRYLNEPSRDEILFQVIERSSAPSHQLKSFVKKMFGDD